MNWRIYQFQYLIDPTLLGESTVKALLVLGTTTTTTTCHHLDLHSLLLLILHQQRFTLHLNHFVLPLLSLP